MAAGSSASPAYLDKAGAPVTPADLSRHAIILGPASLSGHWSFRKGDTAASFQVEGKLTIRASLGAIAAAVEGLGIVIIPLGACRRELERGELVRLFPEWDAGTVELNAVYASGRAAEPSARAFVDYLIAALHKNEPPPSGARSIGEKPRLSLERHCTDQTQDEYQLLGLPLSAFSPLTLRPSAVPGRSFVSRFEPGALR